MYSGDGWFNSSRRLHLFASAFSEPAAIFRRLPLAKTDVMPGLVGLITTMPRARAEAELAQMLRTMRHEPFYETGTWIDESAGVYLGWTARPSAVNDGTPLCNERTGVVLAFSGEDFPEPGTAERLRRAAHSRAIGASRAYLLSLYEQDPSFPAGLNGRFHGLVV